MMGLSKGVLAVRFGENQMFLPFLSTETFHYLLFQRVHQLSWVLGICGIAVSLEVRYLTGRASEVAVTEIIHPGKKGSGKLICCLLEADQIVTTPIR